MLWLTAQQGTQKPYKDQPASLQRWGHQGSHYVPKLAVGLNSVSLCWVPGLHPSPLHHSFLTRLSGGVGEEFRDRHHPGWCPHHTGWALQQCQGFGCFESGTLSAMNGWKRDSIGLGGAPVETPSGSHCVIPRSFPPDHVAKLKCDHFYSGLPKWLKAMVAYLKASTNEKTYSNYLWAATEAGKEGGKWNHLIARWLTILPSLRWWASFLYKSWRGPSLLRPLPYGWHTLKKLALTKKRVLTVMTPMELRAWQRSL